MVLDASIGSSIFLLIRYVLEAVADLCPGLRFRLVLQVKPPSPNLEPSSSLLVSEPSSSPSLMVTLKEEEQFLREFPCLVSSERRLVRLSCPLSHAPSFFQRRRHQDSHHLPRYRRAPQRSREVLASAFHLQAARPRGYARTHGTHVSASVLFPSPSSFRRRKTLELERELILPCFLFPMSSPAKMPLSSTPRSRRLSQRSSRPVSFRFEIGGSRCRV